MTWLEINSWLERYAGVSYDITSMVDDCKGNVVLIDPYTWYTDMNEIVMHYHSIMELIEEYEEAIPDSFNSKAEFEDLIKTHFTDNLAAIINGVCQLLNMNQVKVSSIDDIDEIITMIYKVIEIVKDDEAEAYEAKFDKLNDKYNGRLTDVYSIHASQLLTISTKIDSIIAEEFGE